MLRYVFSDRISKINSNPNLQQDIAGSVQYITSSVQKVTNNAGAAITPEYVFDNVTHGDMDDNNRLYDHLQVSAHFSSLGKGMKKLSSDFHSFQLFAQLN